MINQNDKTQHEEGHWYEGPTMQYKRKNHAVGVVTDKSTLRRLVVVTGGVGEEGELKSTEILLENSWSKGEMAQSYSTKVRSSEYLDWVGRSKTGPKYWIFFMDDP